MSSSTYKLFGCSFFVGMCILFALAATSAEAQPPRVRAHVNRVQAKTVHKAKAVHKAKVHHAVRPAIKRPSVHVVVPKSRRPHVYVPPRYRVPISSGLRFSLSLPSGYATFSLGGVNYYRHGGVYYRRYRHDNRWGYRVVPTPVGLYVSTLPQSPNRVVINGQVYYRSGSTFYMATSPQPVTSTVIVTEPATQVVEQKYIVARPPIGATVDELPPGAQEYQIGGTTYYAAGESHYLPIQIGDATKYVVVDPPKAEPAN